MRQLVKDYPDDLDAQTLLAEALMDTMPWDYWLKDRYAQAGNGRSACRTAIGTIPQPGSSRRKPFLHPRG